jgi:hypothetical protein
MAGLVHENEPLLEEDNNRSSYNAVLVKNIDEELVGSTSSSEIDQHDAEYLVKHRLGHATLPMVTAW